MSTDIGTPTWTRDEVIAALPAFEDVYGRRPIQDNRGGMKAPHAFATWFMARTLAPEVIIESGIWRGQSTWLLEQACPDARIISLDPVLSAREYISERATYHDTDFSELDWTALDPEKTLVFFDDHQNALGRAQQCRWVGLRHLIFEDNYPASCGDCYSLKKAFAGAGFEPSTPESAWRGKLAKMVEGSRSGMLQYHNDRVAPNEHDAQILRRNLEVYHEFPPVFVRENTRWGDPWTEPAYPTPAPLLATDAKDQHPVFWEEAEHYTWICYARLKA